MCEFFARHTAVAAQREEQSRFEGVFFSGCIKDHQRWRCEKYVLECVVNAVTFFSVAHVIFKKRERGKGEMRGKGET